MSGSSDSIYEPLPNSTSIRILVLAPGKPDEDLSFALITSDLDFDHKTFPDSAPTPFKNIAFINAEGEDDSQFPLHVDMHPSATPQDPQLHPFQRYEALSYVWGAIDDQYQIGKSTKVTKNLHSALRSLRLPHSGRKLWVDALCINQDDHEEKKVQLALMKQVYQQADKVIAYLPVSPQDQSNLNKLVPKILRASMAYREHQSSEQTVASDQGQHTPKLNSVSELEAKTVVRDGNEPMSVTMGSAFDGEQPFLESFGLPREDSPLWDSWRRVFSLPYFRRIWIWQEMALGNNLHFWFGNGEAAADPLILAHHFLDEYGASFNASYNAAWNEGGGDDTDNQDTLNDRIVGSGNATKMFRDRLLRVYGRDGNQPKLIRKLAGVGTFNATDPRDKIYALLGMTSDGGSFTQHVSYAPWETKEKTFIRFASLFIDRGEGIEVLLQAGFRDGEPEWRSWVPHWDSLERPVPLDATRGPGTTSTRMRVDADNETLYIHGTIVDTVSVINTAVLETLQVTEDGIDMWRFIRTIISGLSMVFGNLTPRDPEEAFEQLFHVLAQPETRKERPKQEESEESEGDRSPSTHGSDRGIKRDIEALRIGFRGFLSYIMSLKPQIEAVRSNSDEDMAQVVKAESPAEFVGFQRAAIKNLHHRRLCITQSERIIMAPKRTQVGDKVVLFEHCDIPFILRQNSAGPGTLDGTSTYRLIGPAFLHLPENEAALSRDIQEIKII